jgi:hypothetical protein
MKDPVIYIYAKNLKKSHKLPQNHRFLVFKVFGLTRTSILLLLLLFQKLGTGGSLILKYLKNWNW